MKYLIKLYDGGDQMEPNIFMRKRRIQENYREQMLQRQNEKKQLIEVILISFVCMILLIIGLSGGGSKIFENKNDVVITIKKLD